MMKLKWQMFQWLTLCQTTLSNLLFQSQVCEFQLKEYLLLSASPLCWVIYLIQQHQAWAVKKLKLLYKKVITNKLYVQDTLLSDSICMLWFVYTNSLWCCICIYCVMYTGSRVILHLHIVLKLHQFQYKVFDLKHSISALPDIQYN